MNHRLERQLEALERARAPVKYVLLWADGSVAFEGGACMMLH